MPAELDEILAEWRTASGPHIVQGSELRRMAAELDRLRKALLQEEEVTRQFIEKADERRIELDRLRAELDEAREEAAGFAHIEVEPGVTMIAMAVPREADDER